MATFIYCPTTGDRVFAISDARHQPDLLNHSGPAWVRWPNGCRHVLGGVRLTFAAAQPKKWWRDDAKALAASLVSSGGGIAWDDNGAISLVVPVRHAWGAWELMSAASPDEFRWNDTGNLSRMIVGGAATIGRNDGASPSWPWYYQGIRYPAAAETRIDVEPYEEGSGHQVSLRPISSIDEATAEAARPFQPKAADRASAPWDEPELWA